MHSPQRWTQTRPVAIVIACPPTRDLAGKAGACATEVEPAYMQIDIDPQTKENRFCTRGFSFGRWHYVLLWCPCLSLGWPMQSKRRQVVLGGEGIWVPCQTMIIDRVAWH